MLLLKLTYRSASDSFHRAISRNPLRRIQNREIVSWTPVAFRKKFGTTRLWQNNSLPGWIWDGFVAQGNLTMPDQPVEIRQGKAIRLEL